MLNTNMNTNHMITIQHLMSEHFFDSISNRSARPEENTAQKKYLTRLLDHNNIDLLCDKESSLTDLPESWSHKELLYKSIELINREKILPHTKNHTSFQDHQKQWYNGESSICRKKSTFFQDHRHSNQ